MKLLELFAGSRSVGIEAERQGFEVFSVDWTPYKDIDLVMEWMLKFDRHTVWYCQYGDSRAKPTDIWTNSVTWIPRPECRNYKYDQDGNIIDRHCYHESARRGSKTGTQGKKGSYERSIIPQQLCEEILTSIPNRNDEE